MSEKFHLKSYRFYIEIPIHKGIMVLSVFLMRQNIIYLNIGIFSNITAHNLPSDSCGFYFLIDSGKTQARQHALPLSDELKTCSFLLL